MFLGYDVRIIDDNCKEVSKGAEGNIAVYCDPNKQQGGLFAGYVDNDKMTKKVFSNDFYFTGDRGYMDKDDYIWFSSRQDDVIIRLLESIRFTVDVLCCQQIKLFQVVSTSEFHEY